MRVCEGAAHAAVMPGKVAPPDNPACSSSLYGDFGSAHESMQGKGSIQGNIEGKGIMGKDRGNIACHSLATA